MDDDMVKYYKQNPDHYSTGLTRIGCTIQQAKNYSEYFNDLRWYYYTFILNKAKNLQKGSSIIDFGCGTGEDLFFLDQVLHDVQLFGFELSHDTILLNNARLEKVKIKNKIIFTDKFFDIPHNNDIIINFCVLEHVNNPAEFIQQCTDFLAEDGTMVIAFPNHYYWWYWDIVNMSIQKILGNPIRTHSVSLNVFFDAINLSHLKIIHHETFGFRPPQFFFKYLCEHESCHIRRKKDFQLISKAYQKSGLQKFLYLHLFILQKNNMPEKKIIEESKKNQSFFTNILLIMISFKFFLHYQIIAFIQLNYAIKKRLIKDGKS